MTTGGENSCTPAAGAGADTRYVAGIPGIDTMTIAFVWIDTINRGGGGKKKRFFCFVLKSKERELRYEK
jgi:hypothetical protein